MADNQLATYLPFVVAAIALIGGVYFFLNQQSGPKYKKVLDPNNFQEFPISEKTQITHNTAVYRFKLPTEDSILGLPIGQHISLAATLDVKDPKTEKVERKEVVRSYTPVSLDEDTPGYFDMLIKSYPTGNISRHMATLTVGDTMKVKGPKGAMVYTPNMCRRIGMIAGGSGITPMLQIAHAIQKGRSKGDKTIVDLIFANVNEMDILMKPELEKLSKVDGFNVYYVLNNPPEGWKGGVGFVTAEMIKERLPAPAKDVKILICGPPPMVSAIKKATEQLGYEKARPVSKLEDQVFCF